ncbi:MAG: FAD-binding oxidoreductase [Gammaproteobacteria bacterium]|nr:FAD-binding oxidoreductase [Gammaproteobacteria bacterium]
MFGLHSPAPTKEHTNSYYAATAPETDYPCLSGDIDTDVVVIGGGFSGVNTALEFAQQGVDVVLVEARRIAWGASGRNGGQLIGGLGSDPRAFRRQVGAAGVQELIAMGFECVDIVADRIRQYAIDCDLRWGYCDVALRPRHLRWLREEKAFLEQAGYPHAQELLDAQALGSFVGSRAYLGGLYDATGAGHLHPLKLCQAEAAAAAAQGARIFEQSHVRSIEHSARPRVFTEHGSVTARHLVLCSNGYLGDLDPYLATRMVPASSCIIATEPLPEDLAHSVLPRDIAVCDLRTALDYFRLSPDRRLLFGGLSNYTGLLPRHYRDIMRRKMLKVFPQLEDIAIEHSWEGQMGISMNRMPQTGMLGPASYYIQAFSGHGVAPTHMLARVVSDAISGKRERFELLASLRHWPFPGGRYLRRPLMAMGMLYYKALDAL